MTVYGGEVCPFLETLSVWEWGLDLLVAFGIMYTLRTTLIHRLGVPRDAGRISSYNGLRQFTIELLPFIVIGIGVAAFDWLYYGFPFAESGLAAVFVGAVLLGFFAAIDLTLDAERRVIRALTATGRSLSRTPRFYPLSRKFAVLATALMLAMLTMVLMVLSHDLYTSLQSESLFAFAGEEAAMLYAVAFVLATFLIIVLELIRSYSRNLKLLFDNEIAVLEAVHRGELEGQVPIATNDEFGVIARYTNTMIESLKSRTEELERTQDVTIHSLASLAETRDNETGEHLLRTQEYVRILAAELRDPWRLLREDIDLLYKSAPLHDIGKVGIPDAILLKPGKLTEEEWVVMKRHTEYGARALANAEAQLGSNSFLRVAREIADSHHERWDGSGYPRGLAGEAIPRSGRIMALADVYDALTSKRVYKDACSHEKAVEIILEGAGGHFDPAVVEAFRRRVEDFRRIATTGPSRQEPARSTN